MSIGAIALYIIVLIVLAFMIFPVIAHYADDKNWMYGSAASLVGMFVLLGYGGYSSFMSK